MKKGAEPVVGAIFTLVICVIILFVGYVILAQFFGTTSEQKAFNNLQQEIEHVCKTKGDMSTSISFWLPAGNSIHLKQSGTIELWGSNKIIASKVLACPNTVTFTACSIISLEGKENINLLIIKNNDVISLQQKEF
ncbi:MAG: hypothetical protein QW063_00470 [Candidatus Nanoarchaeia archaeon]